MFLFSKFWKFIHTEFQNPVAFVAVYPDFTNVFPALSSKYFNVGVKITMSQNGQADFKILAANDARFLNDFLSFDIHIKG